MGLPFNKFIRYPDIKTNRKKPLKMVFTKDFWISVENVKQDGQSERRSKKEEVTGLNKQELNR